MSEEDWFERAISGDDETEDGEAVDSEAVDGSGRDGGAGENDGPGGDGPSGDVGTGVDDDRPGGDDETGTPDGAPDVDDTETVEEPESSTSTDAAGDQTEAAAPDDSAGERLGPEEADDETVAEQLGEDQSGDDDRDGGLFDEDFAAALDGAEVDPGGGLESGEFDDAGDLDSSGGGFGTSDSGGGFGTSDSGGGFGGDFGMGSGGGGDGFGDAGVPEDDDLESDIPRIDLGIEGLDDMIQGGVPERTLMVAIGSAGTGKTTFGLQFLDHGLENGENGVYITLEESRERVIRSATEKGFAFDEYAEDGSLAVIDLDPVEMATSLQTIGGELPRLIEAFDAERLVLDSVSLLEMMYDDRARRRNEIYDFTKALKDSGVTTMMTSEASEDTAYASRHGIVEYLTDAVFVLQYVRPSDFRETRLAIEIQKIRDANHSRETKPYEITDEGISVYRQANLF